MLFSRVVGSQVFVLSTLISDLSELLEECKFSFAPDLGFTEALTVYKTYKARINDPSTNDLPMIFWNKDAMAFGAEADERGRRKYWDNVDGDEDRAEFYDTYVGDLNLNFSFVANKWEDMDVFELVYNIKINPLKTVVINYPGISYPIKYLVDWKELSGPDLSRENNLYFIVNFSAVLSGPWFMFRETYPFIKEIRNYYRLLDGTLVDEDIIVVRE